MLRKLLKHEFRATGRIMLPMYLVLLILSVVANVSVRVLDASQSTFPRILGGVFLVLFFTCIFVVSVMAVVLMVRRFRANLMSDEGYIMFTLPVSIHQQVWSKIIVSSVWLIVTGLADLLAMVLVVFRVGYMTELASHLQEVFSQISAYYAWNGAAFAAELLVLVFVACAVLCLEFYAAIAVGHSFDNHKILLSVVFFIVFQVIAQILGVVGLMSWDNMGMFWSVYSGMAAVHGAFWAAIGGSLIYGVAYYVITVLMLKKRLNLA